MKQRADYPLCRGATVLRMFTAWSFFLATAASVHAQEIPPSVAWSAGLIGEDVAVGLDGNPVILGSPNQSSDFEITKLDGVTGAVLWSVTLDSGEIDAEAGVAVGPDGHPVVTGTIRSPTSSSIWVIKLNGSTGAILWNILFVSGAFPGGNGDTASDISVGPDGHPVVVGATDMESGGDFRIVKLDGATGAVLWTAAFDTGDDGDYLASVGIGQDGNPVLAGQSNSDSTVVKYDGETGDVIWTWSSALAVFELYANAVALDNDGDVVVTGQGYCCSLTTVKLDGISGSLMWSRGLDIGGLLHVGYDVTLDAHGDPIVTGTRTLKYDGQTGEIQWLLAPENGALIEGKGIASGPDGKLVVTGESTVKYGSPDKTIQWLRAIDTDSIASDTHNVVGIGPDGNPVVSGSIGQSDWDFRTVKIDGITGAVLWDVTFDSGGNDVALGVGVGPDNHPVVVGRSFGGVESSFRVVKYDGANGSVLWNVTFGSADAANAVAIGSDGHPVVVGTSYNGADNDIGVIKFDGATGGVLWSITYDSGSEDWAPGVAIGSDGNPVVTSTVSSPNSDIRVIKFDGVTGAILWNVVFDSGDQDVATAVAVGPDGNPVVSGGYDFIEQPGGNGHQVIRMIKYDGSTGSVLWNVTGGETTPGNDTLGGVAVAPDGSVVVTGGPDPTVGHTALHTARYDGSTGAVLSEFVFDTLDEEAFSSVSIGPDGNPVVAVTSYFESGASLWVIKYLIDTDGDGLPDTWETLFGLNPNDPSDARLDSDGDGLTNFQEYIGGADPQDGDSTPSSANTLDDVGQTLRLVVPTGVTVTSFEWVDPATLPTSPAGSLPNGLVSIELQGLTPGQTKTIALTFPISVPAGSFYAKYGPTPDDPTNHWYPFPFGSDDGDATITLTLTDGGAGDHDLTANGVIVDPGGPSLTASLGPELINISTRARVETGDNVMIGGFWIGGTGNKTVLIRARGGSLGGAPFNNPGVLANPTMQLYSGSTVIAQNNDWGGFDPTCVSPCVSNAAVSNTSVPGLTPCEPNPGQSTAPPGCAQESAILVDLPPGGYTAIVSGVGGTSGMGLVEVFEISSGTATLINISTRSRVQTGDNVMIGGFWIGGATPKNVLIRARGGSLGGAPFNNPGVLANPTMQLYSGSTVVAQNNDWGVFDATCVSPCVSTTAVSDTSVPGLTPCEPNPGQSTAPPGCNQESAILVTLDPGGYTAIVNGVGGTSGMGLVEVFEVP